MSILSKTIIGVLILAATLIITFRAIDHEPVNDLSFQGKTIAIIDNSGCMVCHRSNPKLPWYSKLPLIGNKINRDSKKGFASINLQPYYDSILSAGQISKEIASRVDSVIVAHDMPPISYSIIRPGSRVNGKEREILLEWNKIHQ
ncbi:MAG: heme-binding domain-containing protein [Bacteroidales bacterium]|nr:heme-binding domain-containing protein [Bacteroidales bacterium]